MQNDELIKALRCEKDCKDCSYWQDNAWSHCDEWGMRCDAADAIERLQSDLAKKDSQLTEWKNAWRIANSLYKSAQAEIDEHRAYQHELVERIETLKAEQNGEEKHEQV